jgi:hypothetical protein
MKPYIKKIDGKLIANSGGRKTILRTGLTETEARSFCQYYNLTNNPGPLSVKAEYTGE